MTSSRTSGTKSNSESRFWSEEKLGKYNPAKKGEEYLCKGIKNDHESRYANICSYNPVNITVRKKVNMSKYNNLDKRTNYIATQAPCPKYFDLFRAVLWQEEVQIAVVLNKHETGKPFKEWWLKGKEDDDIRINYKEIRGSLIFEFFGFHIQT